MSSTASLTPMLRQYLEVKAQHPDAVVLYRMGDFYEMFFEDARLAAPILEVQLTARHRGSEHETPMCGVPHHALDSYLAKLIGAGLRVAICDQVEDPAQAKGLVKRAVTRVVTPGTVSDPGLLEGKEENLLAALAWDGDAGAGAFLDVSTGAFFVRRWASFEEGVGDLAVLRPREALVPEGLPSMLGEWLERECPCRTPLGDRGDRLDGRRGAELLCRQFGTATLRGFGLVDGEPAVSAAAAALAYAHETQKSELSHIRGLTLREPGDALLLDATTLANLEVFRTQREGRRRGSLLGVLDRTVTPPGGRLLRDWLRRPLADPAAVSARHDAVAELASDHARRASLRERLARVGDPERLLGRAVLGSLSPREAAALRDGLAELPALLGEVAELGLVPALPLGLPAEAPAARIALLAGLAATNPLPELAADLRRTLQEAPAPNLEEGGVIAAGIDEDLDRYRSLARDSKRHIAALEVRERERTGINSLKIRYNRVFGYYVEVTRAQQERVPDDYIRKQTLVNAERYVTPEIKQLEEQILSAEERQVALEREHFRQLTARIAAAGEGLTRVAA
ncbi:MAG TPA: DNA mismatch repair protein MutS, partial [Thermoanaerobaculia bacterium]|nr:DNA mismatch repair protein MutS [Thermoanaerobaculia bacterium]